MELSHVPKRRPGVEIEVVGDQAVMLDADGTVARGLNATAAQVWALVDGRRTVAQIARELQAAADPERVERDVLAFLTELERRRLVE
jgi:hypothetical protein